MKIIYIKFIGSMRLVTRKDEFQISQRTPNQKNPPEKNYPNVQLQKKIRNLNVTERKVQKINCKNKINQKLQKLRAS
jgi:hypothetical protein